MRKKSNKATSDPVIIRTLAGRFDVPAASFREWKELYQFTLVREDGRLERQCEAHGVGHTVGHIRGYLLDAWETVHGCCGCCTGWPYMETRPNLPQEKEPHV